MADESDRSDEDEGAGESAGKAAARSAYVTPEGFAKLREELDQLWRVERPKVTEAVSRAAALGDRSENADYIYGKRRLREIDRRVRFLQKRLDELVVVDRPPDREGKVYFGAFVSVEGDDGAEQTWRIVGPDEFDAGQGTISMDSPLGRALLGRVEGDAVIVRRPRGAATFTVRAIRYARDELEVGPGEG
jgi:transcription elongation factor GreB